MARSDDSSMGLRGCGAVSSLSSVNRQAGLIPIDAATLFVSMGARPAKSLINVQRRFALGLAEILDKHIAEQCTLFNGVVEGDVGMGMRVEPMFGHAAFGAAAIVLLQQGHGVGFDIERGEAEGAFAGEANQVTSRRIGNRIRLGSRRILVFREGL